MTLDQSLTEEQRYSDEWHRLGYSSEAQTKVSDFVFYRLWHDQAGNEIGATVDFETANDFHYEMPIAEWQRFLRDILRVKEPEDVTDALRGYFLLNEGLFDFERDLNMHGIVFQKIAFY